MSANEVLEPGKFYHIYNRGNNKENLFREERNYFYFLNLWSKHIFPIAETFAYCLLPNHFHFAVRIRGEEDLLSRQTSQVSKTCEVLCKQAFSNFFNAYTKTINSTYKRTGSLFQERFKRKEIN